MRSPRERLRAQHGEGAIATAIAVLILVLSALVVWKVAGVVFD